MESGAMIRSLKALAGPARTRAKPKAFHAQSANLCRVPAGGHARAGTVIAHTAETISHTSVPSAQVESSLLHANVRQSAGKVRSVWTSTRRQRGTMDTAFRRGRTKIVRPRSPETDQGILTAVKSVPPESIPLAAKLTASTIHAARKRATSLPGRSFSAISAIPPLARAHLPPTGDGRHVGSTRADAKFDPGVAQDPPPRRR